MSAESAPAWKSVRLAHEALKANRPQAALEHLDRAMWSQETNVKDPNAKTVVNHEMFEGRQRSSEASPACGNCGHTKLDHHGYRHRCMACACELFSPRTKTDDAIDGLRAGDARRPDLADDVIAVLTKWLDGDELYPEPDARNALTDAISEVRRQQSMHERLRSEAAPHEHSKGCLNVEDCVARGCKMLPDAWQDEDDKPLPEDAAIDAAFPTRSGRHDLYAEAMRMVGAKYSKGGLVALVNWLLHDLDAAFGPLATKVQCAGSDAKPCTADAQPEQRTNRQIADRLGQMVTSAGAWLPRHENALVRMLDEQRRESAAADAPPDLATVAKHLRDIESLDCTIDDDAHDHDSQECPFRTARQIARLALGELRRERAKP